MFSYAPAESPAGTSFWRARFFSAITPLVFLPSPLFTMLLLCYLLLPSFLSFFPILSYRGISPRLLPPPFSKIPLPATATSTPAAIIIRKLARQISILSLFISRPGGWRRERVFLILIDPNYSPPSGRTILLRFGEICSGESFRNIGEWGGGYFSRIDERRITSKSVMGRGIGPSILVARRRRYSLHVRASVLNR